MFSLAPGASGSGDQRLGRRRRHRCPWQSSSAGPGSSFPSAICSWSPRLKRTGPGPPAATRPAYPALPDAARCPARASSVSDGRASAAAIRGSAGRAAAAPSPARSVASVQVGQCGLPCADADHFPLDMSSRCELSSERLCDWPFFCCGRGGPCYKPAARGIAAGHDAISGRGGTGRRAGFRFQ